MSRGIHSLAAIGATSAAALAFASPTVASGSLNRCGAVHGTVAVVSQGVGCHKARRVANDYLSGNKNPLGFQCKRYSSNAGAGYYAKCTRQGAYVQIIPE